MLVFYKKYKRTRFFVPAVILLPFIYFFLKLEPHIHYFLIITPFLYLFLGVSISYFFSVKNQVLKTAAKTLFVSLILFSLYYNFAFYSTIGNLRNIQGDYGQIYADTEKDIKIIYKPYENDPHYDEMIIASYVPYGLTHGNIGIARMLYDPKETERNMEVLEERLKRVPVDRRVQNELIAYFTRQIPNEESIETLRTKSAQIPGLTPIYEEVLKFYKEAKK